MNDYIQLWYDKYETEARTLMHDIWEHPEFAMEEYYTAGRLAGFMKEQGFETRTFNAKEPQSQSAPHNTVYAKWGSGKPVIGILGELDSLKGLGQENVPYYSPVPGCGHGCGHNLIAGCGAAAASSLKFAAEREDLSGTIIYVGCPAEETLDGKVWLAKWGYFDDMDVCLMWHPGGHELKFAGYTNMALTSILFEYFGKTAHGVRAWNGRSALDACELMNIGVNYLREHMTPECSIHYVYEDGGDMPNVVPEHASVFYYIRSRDEENRELVERVKAVAQGAAIMTETKLKMTLRTYCRGNFPAIALNRYVYEEVKKIPPLTYSGEDYEFARKLHRNFFEEEPPEEPDALIPVKTSPVKDWDSIPFFRGTSDVGDVSHILPTIQLSGLGKVAGTRAHHWTVTAAAGTAIGEKAAVYTSKIISQSALDILKNPGLVEGFWKDFTESRNARKMPPYEKCSFRI